MDNDLKKSFAPTGTLRACINTGNAVLVGKRPSGEVFGVSVDLAHELGRHLGLPVALHVVDSAIKSVEAVRAGVADVGFFAIDPVRGEGIAFTAPYVLIEGAYAVRLDSSFQTNADVDHPGHKVVVGRGSAYDLYLTRELKRAELVRAETSQQVVDTFLAGRHDVAAAVKQQLEADLKRVSGLRLLPGRFMVIEQAMGLAKTRGDAAHTALRTFVESMKSTGFVAEALKRHGIQGASIAPLAG